MNTKMTKQEEIREGIKEILKKVIAHTLADGYNDLDDIISELLKLEDKLGVVIRVFNEGEIKLRHTERSIGWITYEPIIGGE